MLYMLKPIEMDENVTLAVQLEEEEGGGPVILINKFNIKPEDVYNIIACSMLGQKMQPTTT